MLISVIGLGYVGAVSAACLAKQGHSVIGVDPNLTKVDRINDGAAPIVEADLDDILKEAVDSGRLRATDSAVDAIMASEISLICVGTPSQLNGSLDLQYVRSACEEIGVALRLKKKYHVVVMRSTILPGTMRDVVIPTLEASSGGIAGQTFGVCINPEFLREGTAVHDYFHPPKTVVGESDTKAGDLLVELYEDFDAPLVRVPLEVAEMVKYSDNVWHALKICFANEIGNICKALALDSHQVMEIFCKDQKLNLSPYYLRPGFAFGGSCLPKDVRAISHKARALDLELPVISSILASNHQQVERGLRLIQSKGRRRIGILGFSFKAGTDDLRESPIVEVIESLLGKGYEIKIYDRNVNVSKLMGSNKGFILNHIPHIAKLMVDSIEQILEHAELIVIGNAAKEFAGVIEQVRPDVSIVDLVRISDDYGRWKNYDGICW